MIKQLEPYKKLQEMTQRISPLTTELSKYQFSIENKETYQEVINNNPIVMFNYKDNSNAIICYLKKDSDTTMWYGMNKEDKTIDYVCELQIQSVPCFNQSWVSQRFVWRKGEMFKGITQDMIFNIYLLKYKTIVADILQSPDGEKFWLGLVEISFKRNLNVYILNFNEGSVTKINNLIEFENLLRDPITNPWGNDLMKQVTRVAISNQQFN